MKISINAGHTISGAGSGAVGIINESEHTRIIADKVIKLLKSAGHEVYNSTVDYATNTTESLYKIVQQVNGHKFDLFVSIHLNALNGISKGCEVYTYKGKELPEAVEVVNNLSVIGFNNRGVKDGSEFYVIRKTDCKAMLIEVFFCDNAQDVDMYLCNVDKIAVAIASAINSKPVTNTNSYLQEFEEAKQELMKLGITDGSNPKESVTREEAWTMLYRLYKKLK